MHVNLLIGDIVTNNALGPINPLTPNDTYRARTAPLTSKVVFYIFTQQI